MEWKNKYTTLCFFSSSLVILINLILFSHPCTKTKKKNNSLLQEQSSLFSPATSIQINKVVLLRRYKLTKYRNLILRGIKEVSSIQNFWEVSKKDRTDTDYRSKSNVWCCSGIGSTFWGLCLSHLIYIQIFLRIWINDPFLTQKKGKKIIYEPDNLKYY